MTKPTKDSRITNATVEAAKRDADAGLDWQHPGPECKGLSLRVRGRGVSWTFRGPRLAGQNRRWTLGDHRVSPKEARQRAWAVRGRIQQGLDPTSLVTALVTGVDEQQQLDLRVEVQPSWEWSDALDRFLADIIGTTRQATRDDYRGTLKNTPELQVFCGRQVCDIVREEIAEAVEKVRKRGVKTHHKKVLVVTRRFFNWLGSDARRRYTSVAENFLLGAKASAAERDVPGRRVVNKGIPDALPIGRSLAIARSDVLGTLPSLGIQTVLGTVSRRRGVVGMRSQDYEPYRPGIYVWFQPPAFRKTADKIQSVAAHQVPLVGWAAGVVDILERRLRSDDTARWLFPVARPRHAGTVPKTPHMNVGTLNHNIGCDARRLRPSVAAPAQGGIQQLRKEVRRVCRRRGQDDPRPYRGRRRRRDPRTLRRGELTPGAAPAFDRDRLRRRALAAGLGRSAALAPEASSARKCENKLAAGGR
jgi:hypothetical protein